MTATAAQPAPAGAPLPTSDAGTGAHTCAGLVVQRTRLRLRRRVLWLRELFGSTFSASELALDERDTPENEHRWQAEDPAGRELSAQIERVESRLAGHEGRHLSHVVRTFRLDEHESDLLQACLGLELCPSLGSALALLAPGAPWRAFDGALAARVMGHDRPSLWTTDGMLARWGLVAVDPTAPNGAAPGLRCAPEVAEWLDQRLPLDALGAGCRELTCAGTLGAWPVEESAAWIAGAVGAGDCACLVLVGRPGSGRRTFAGAVGDRLGLRVIGVSTDTPDDAAWNERWLAAQRAAAIGGRALAWHGRIPRRPVPQSVCPVPVQFLIVEADESSMRPAEGVAERIVVLAEPSVSEREQLWRRAIDLDEHDAEGLRRLAARYRATPGEIERVGRSRPSTLDGAAMLLREMARVDVGQFAEVVECPYTWDDLILPEPILAHLREFVREAEDRVRLLERPDLNRLLARERGQVGLVVGPPGVGKTMAAQVVARDLGLDLVRIDLASVTSKYIGETIKNLRQVFDRCSRMRALLLFDEADALFARRTTVHDAHDKHSNSDLAYLLQLLESFRGAGLLASNRKGVLDAALLRRVRHIIDFPRPDIDARYLLWRRLVSAMAGDEAAVRLNATLEWLAREAELTPAQIKQSVLGAIFNARRRASTLEPDDLRHGLDREMRKEGRTPPLTRAARRKGVTRG